MPGKSYGKGKVPSWPCKNEDFAQVVIDKENTAGFMPPNPPGVRPGHLSESLKTGTQVNRLSFFFLNTDPSLPLMISNK